MIEQLEKLPINLSACRNAILYKGGNIGEVAKFNNLASEIDSIPVGDTNYVLVDDSETAYRKEILPGASELVKVKKIGGKTSSINKVPLDNIRCNNNIVRNYNNGSVTITDARIVQFSTIPLSVGTYAYAVFDEMGRIVEISHDSPASEESSGIFTISEEGTVKRVNMEHSLKFNGTYYIMCWKGDTIPTIDDFVPYGIFENVKVTEFRSEGANLIPFPYAETTKTVNGITFTVLENGGIQIEGTATKNATFTLANPIDIKLIHGQSYKINSNSNANKINAIIAYKDTEGTIKYSSDSSSALIWDSSYEVYSIYIQVEPGISTNVIIYPMLNIGTVALSYKPYSAEPIDTFVVPDVELNGINERVYDYIDLENGTIVKASQKIIFDGSDDEAWERDTVGTYTSRFSIPFSAAKSGGAGLCSNNNYVSSGIGDDKKLCCCYSDRFFYRVPKTIATVAQFREWIVQNPITLFYEAKALDDVTDISASLPKDVFIKVQAGGSIVAVNEKEEAVPTNISYIRRIS